MALRNLAAAPRVLLLASCAAARTIVSAAGRQTLFSKKVLLPDMRVLPAAITVAGSTIESVTCCNSPPANCERLIDFGDQLLTPAFILQDPDARGNSDRRGGL